MTNTGNSSLIVNDSVNCWTTPSGLVGMWVIFLALWVKDLQKYNGDMVVDEHRNKSVFWLVCVYTHQESMLPRLYLIRNNYQSTFLEKSLTDFSVPSLFAQIHQNVGVSD